MRAKEIFAHNMASKVEEGEWAAVGAQPWLPTCRVKLCEACRVAEQHEPALEHLLAALQGGCQLGGNFQGVWLCEGVILQDMQLPAV